MAALHPASLSIFKIAGDITEKCTKEIIEIKLINTATSKLGIVHNGKKEIILSTTIFYSSALWLIGRRASLVFFILQVFLSLIIF